LDRVEFPALLAKVERKRQTRILNQKQIRRNFVTTLTATADLKAQHAELLREADAIVTTAERQKRSLTPSENSAISDRLARAENLKTQIANTSKPEDPGTLRAKLDAMRVQYSIPRVSSTRSPEEGEPIVPKRFLTEYRTDFYIYLQSFGQQIRASLTESVDAAGGFAAPITVDNQIVPLAPQDLAVRRLATVIPTKGDRLIPQKSTFGSAALTTETSAFAGTAPALSQISLGAYMVGTLAAASLEILQDVPEFEAFVLDDISLDIQTLEENWFVNGTGSGQPQGLIGNVGAGITDEPDTNGNLISINATLDVIGSLNSMYYANATWLMSRATAIGLRKAQLQSNAYVPLFHRENGQDTLHGYPVAYSESMPTASRGACPCLFGDFRRGYIVADRGGSAVRLKVIDQLFGSQGTIGLIGYRRCDGKVRRSEAIQSLNVSAS
jgi:HK97 family phage major capsid protein